MHCEVEYSVVLNHTKAVPEVHIIILISRLHDRSHLREPIVRFAPTLLSTDDDDESERIGHLAREDGPFGILYQSHLLTLDTVFVCTP